MMERYQDDCGARQVLHYAASLHAAVSNLAVTAAACSLLGSVQRDVCMIGRCAART